MREILRWLQGVGVGAVWAIYAFVQGAGPTAEPGSMEYVLQGALVAVLVRIVGWLVGKLPTESR